MGYIQIVLHGAKVALYAGFIVPKATQ
jgi:hypothetical protein